MTFVRIIDTGSIFQNDDTVDELTEFTIEAPIPNGMYAVPGVTPKWEGGHWVEVVSAPTPPPTAPVPTTEERLNDLETTQSEIVDTLASALGVTL